jgi:uncharacterized membrane protein HdeD (DUF308 family)
MLLQTLARNWWILLLRGIAAIVFGLIALAWPGVTLLVLITLYGAYALADGLLSLLAACRGGTVAPRWWLILVGLLGLAAGAMTFSYPGVTALLLLMFIGIWCVVRGLFEIIGAIQLRKEIDNEWTLILSGLVSIFFGAYVLAWPGVGALALLWVIGAYSLVAGILLISFAFRLRRYHTPHA